MCGNRWNDRRMYSAMIYIYSCLCDLDSQLEREMNTGTSPFILKSCAAHRVFLCWSRSYFCCVSSCRHRLRGSKSPLCCIVLSSDELGRRVRAGWRVSFSLFLFWCEKIIVWVRFGICGVLWYDMTNCGANQFPARDLDFRVGLPTYPRLSKPCAVCLRDYRLWWCLLLPPKLVFAVSAAYRPATIVS